MGMDVFAKYVSGIDNPDHRLKAEEILSWTAGQFPNLEAQIQVEQTDIYRSRHLYHYVCRGKKSFEHFT